MPETKYNIDEAFELAEQIERNGAAFYRAAAGLMANEAAGKLLRELADEEDQHLKTFAEMRSILVSDESRLSGDLARAFVQAVAGRFVFDTAQTPAEQVSGLETPLRILDVAIEKEMQSILFYSGLRGWLGDEGDRAAVHAIDWEERKHFIKLTKQRRELAGG
ncbi:MAG: ferritin family protein [Kiritimatiellae bacterium]|nr:ferritin family protein [Kiritimatiellia bacterium]